MRPPSGLDFLWGDAHLDQQEALLMEANMAHYDAADREHDRSAFKGRNYSYRFGSAQARHGRGRAALNHVNGYLKTLIEKLADAKARRMRRELELRGLHFDPVKQAWVTERRRQRADGV
jgi:hypothetical protein